MSFPGRAPASRSRQVEMLPEAQLSAPDAGWMFWRAVECADYSCPAGDFAIPPPSATPDNV